MSDRRAPGPAPLPDSGASRLDAVERLRQQLAEVESRSRAAPDDQPDTEWPKPVRRVRISTRSARAGADSAADRRAGGRGRGAAAGTRSDARDSDTPRAGTEAQAKDICLRLLTDRARSRAELADKLAAKGFAPEIADRVLNRLAEVGLVDDAAFAEQWVHSRHTFSGRGKKALAQELRRKGVADDDAQPALAAITPDDESSRAAELVRRKLTTLPVDMPRDKRTARLVGMLARRGYSQSIAYRVVTAELSQSPDSDPPAATAPASIDAASNDAARAAELVRRKIRTMPRNLPRDKMINRLVGMLARRGCASSVAYSVVRAELEAADVPGSENSG
ncbi:MAG: recombination regulator RecX [Nocardia sp.]|nr:recombination regulator RecX [Nocardia sp.]